jgi:hypothetical protein
MCKSVIFCATCSLLKYKYKWNLTSLVTWDPNTVDININMTQRRFAYVVLTSFIVICIILHHTSNNLFFYLCN